MEILMIGLMANYKDRPTDWSTQEEEIALRRALQDEQRERSEQNVMDYSMYVD